MSPFEMTEEFHQTFDPTRPEQPRPFTPEKASFRAGFKVEELVEFLYAAANNDPEQFAQSVADLHQGIEQAKEKITSKQNQ